jgi:signal transduction histidine kinase
MPPSASRILGDSSSAASIRALDWASTPVGDLGTWSDTLLNAVNLILAAPLPMQLLWGPNLVCIDNDAMTPALFGKHPASLGRPARQVWAEIWPTIGPQLQQVLTEARAFRFDDVVLPFLRDGVREDQSWTYSYSPVFDPGGTIVGVLSVAQDNSRRAIAERALQQRTKVLVNERLVAAGHMATSIAHEINNPLHAVTNLVILALDHSNLEEVHAYLRLAELELQRVHAIAIQTIRFQHPSTRPITVSCEELFAGVLAIYSSHILNARILVEKRKRARTPVLCLDAEIRQVLGNLVANAIDAMPSGGGRLLLRSREARDVHTHLRGIVLTVADTGPGIPPQAIPHIFEPFYSTKGISGTGLGLWISREIVEHHVGRLSVRTSRRAGRSGSVFTVFLPFNTSIPPVTKVSTTASD